eukprot:2192156-Rhodomonas_salina.1
MQEYTWELARLVTVGQVPLPLRCPRERRGTRVIDECGCWQEGSRHTVMGVHVTAVLVAASLFNSNSEGRFHSNMASNAARN